MICPKCKNPMKNLGNIHGVVLGGQPPEWTDIYVCLGCRLKKHIDCVGEIPISLSDIADFEEIK